MVHIKGAVGCNSGRVNGFYVPTDEIVGKASVYQKLGEQKMYIEYYAPLGMWNINTPHRRGTGRGFASCDASPPLPLEQCPLNCWMVWGDSSFVEQPSLSVSVTTMAAFQAFEDAQVV